MDTETGTESTQESVVENIIEATPSEGTQPKIESIIPNPAPETQGSEPTIPYSRFQEVNRRMREAEAALNQRNQQQQQPQQAQPVESGAPKEEQFETYTDYIRAEARYHAEKAADKRFNDLQTQQRQSWEQQQEQAKESKAGSNFVQKWAAEVSKDPSLKTLPTDPVMEMPKSLAVLVMGSEVAGPLMAHLLRNPEETYRISSLPSHEAAYAIGKMESKLSGSTGQPTKKPSGNIPSLDPVGVGKGKGFKSADDMSQEDVLRRLYPY